MKTPPIYSNAPADWQISQSPIAYPGAVKKMEARAAAIAAGGARELVWALQHTPLYTAGTSAKESDLLTPSRFPVFKTGRGGQYTYHGPGQLVVYFMLDLTKRGRDVRAFVCALEDLIIETLAVFGVKGERRAGRVGVWTVLPDGREAKIAALGVRIRKWVSFHGISINVNPDLSHFDGIVPCGITEHGVTSLAALGAGATMDDVIAALQQSFETRFGPVEKV